MNMGLSLCQVMECSCCKQNFYSKESAASTAAIFGAVRYSFCLICCQEVDKPWTPAYKRRWDKWANKLS